jgi:protein tyrosine/serine phosphatase
MKQSQIISSDAQAVNFRQIRMGSIPSGKLYRSSHPIKDNKQEKAISLLATNARIMTVLNLSDTTAEITKKAFYAPWYNNLLKTGRVIALDMDFMHNSDNFRKKLKKGLRFIINTEGPWLIHCHAGVDRTGFVFMVLEALMGATVDEIVNDYLQSFNSIFDSHIYGEVNTTDSQVAMHILSAMSDSQAIDDNNLQAVAENYVRNVIGLSAEELGLLRNKLEGRLLQKNPQSIIL